MKDCPDQALCQAGDACAGRCSRRSGANTPSSQAMGQFYTSTHGADVYLVERNDRLPLTAGEVVKQLGGAAIQWPRGSKAWHIDTESEVTITRINADWIFFDGPEVTGEVRLDRASGVLIKLTAPCRSPYCECEAGRCSHLGFQEARHLPAAP